MADVAGKGVPAALLMSNVQAALCGLTVAGASVGLAETLVQLNELVFDATPTNRFITMFALAYEPESRTLRYASAGHNPAALLLHGAAHVEWIRTKGVALGLRRRSDFAESSLTLRPGDCLVLYTDGVTEAVNTTGEEFGEARLVAAVDRCRTLGATDMRDALVAEVDGFAVGAPQHDDITLVVLRAT
ncbi:MAG: PP2C family protein-serine/threonine phosphatase [Bryobacterales bacterium]|nr:PP2C family protein-serine/threonine phosphatase [Bryobacterales bacterium]